MTNKEIARSFRDLANLMELHEENTFKIRSYQNAYMNLRKLGAPLSEMEDVEILGIKGVGKAIVGKINELVTNGQMATLEKFREKTPEGVQELLKIKGFGPKKIRVVWKEMGFESVGELLYACYENRLIEQKGFGEKSQNDLKHKLEFYLRSKDSFLYASLEEEAEFLKKLVQENLPNCKVELAGEIRRRCNIVNGIELLIAGKHCEEDIFDDSILRLEQNNGNFFKGKSSRETPVSIYSCTDEEFGSKLFRYTGTKAFIEAFLSETEVKDFRKINDESVIFQKAGIAFIEPELRENGHFIKSAKIDELPQLIENEDIKGVVHCHTTYSDGIHSLQEMAEYARSLNYEYLAISDHSRSAFYANGLRIPQLEKQWAEIDALNKEMAPFRIFKSIESDILFNGDLDYPGEILEQFDFVIASIHSNLKMDEQKATARLIKAIENRHTKILGHPTGRLLLARQAYPMDHQKVIDACAANGVSIELNSNPYRLDLDWTWIPYALEKGILISINPDAHSKEGMRDINFGVLSARKGGLTKANCLTAMSVQDFENFILDVKS